MRRTALVGVAILAAIFAVRVAAPVVAQQAETPGWLQRHPVAPDPANLSPAEAEAIYADIADEMARALASLDDPMVPDYRAWTRYNTAPYRSEAHGSRYVNNYANDIGADYGLFEAAGPMPEGAVIIKDTFYVSTGGDVFPGALMVMEKMAPGFDAENGDWRYAMILPDGTSFGVSGGENAQNVAFCAACHAVAAGNDYLFFIPQFARPAP